MFRRWVTPVVLGAFLFLGVTRLPVIFLLGIALLIGVVDVKWVNPERTDVFSQAIRPRIAWTILMALILTILGLLYPLRI